MGNFKRNWWSSYQDSYSEGFFNDDSNDKDGNYKKSWYSGYVPKTGYGYYKHSYYKKPDIISPTLHYVDESRVNKAVDNCFNDLHAVQKIWEIVLDTQVKNKKVQQKFRAITMTDQSQFIQNAKAMLKTIPEHVKYDIFKMYYHSTSKLEYEERTDKNKTEYEYIDAALNPIAKVMTEGSNLKSVLFTKDMMMYFAIMKVLEHAEQKQQNGGKNNPQNNPSQDTQQDGGNSPGSKNKSSMSLNSELGKTLLENILENTKQVCSKMDSIMDKDMQELLYNGELKIDKLSVSNLNPDVLKNIEASLSSMEMNTKQLKEKLNKLLDRSTSNFSAQRKTEYKDIFSVEDFSMLDEYEMLHPKIRKIMMEDIMIPQLKYMGKVDIYVDASGSMSEFSGLYKTQEDGTKSAITRCDLAKMIVYKLYKMGILSNLYIFENDVREISVNPVSIASITPRGGTNIERVVKKIEEEQRNAIVVTDAEDNCGLYTTKAFFLGTLGASFNHFTSDVLEKYAESKQMIIYDGSCIHDIDANGRIIS